LTLHHTCTIAAGAFCFPYLPKEYVSRLVSSATFQSRGDGDGGSKLSNAAHISLENLPHHILPAEQDKTPTSLTSLLHHEYIPVFRGNVTTDLTLHLAADGPQPNERWAYVSRQSMIFASVVAKRHWSNLCIYRASCRALRSSQRIVQRMFVLDHVRI
jgi:hypothetical protein